MYLVFDCETTGLFDYSKPADAPGQPRLCSIAAALINEEGNQVDGMHYLVRPSWNLQERHDAEEAFRVNGLSWEKLMDEGKDLVGILAQWTDLEDRATGITGYGVQFDLKMMRAERRRLNLEDRFGYRPDFCCLQGARKLHKFSKTPKLVEAVKVLLGHELQEAHDAMADLSATLLLFAHLKTAGVVEWKQRESDR